MRRRILMLATWALPFACSDALVGDQNGSYQNPCSDDYEFEACGGNVLGMWEFDYVCPNVPPDLATVPLTDLAECADLEWSYDIDDGSSIEFYVSGQFTFRLLPYTEEAHLVVDAACLGAVEVREQISGCEAVEEAISRERDIGGECHQANGGCSCYFLYIRSESRDVAPLTGSYTVSGSGLTLTYLDSDPFPGGFCVEEDLFTWQVVEGGETRVYFLSRKTL